MIGEGSGSKGGQKGSEGKERETTTMDVSRMRFVSSSCAPTLVLGSQSPTRRELLRKWKEAHPEVQCRHMAADLDERNVRCEDEEKLAMAIATAKKEALLPRLRMEGGPKQRTWLVTCDQVVVQDGCAVHKPKDAEEARRRLAQGGQVETRSAVVCCDVESGWTTQALDVAHVDVGPLPQHVVEQLLEEGEVYGCAGGIMVEHPLVQPHVTFIQGSMDSVLGLPLDVMEELLVQVAETCWM